MNKFPRLKFLYIFCFIILFLGVITPVSLSASSSTTELYVEPSKVEFWTPALNEIFMINITIANVSTLQGFELKLQWNTTHLDLSKVVIQPFLNPPTSVFRNETREDLGRYWLGVMSHGSAKDGSGALATLSFKITYEPTWPENVTSVLNLTDTKLSNPAGQPIAHEVYDGEYSCYSTPPLGITLMTTRPSYYLLDNIHIYGNLTMGDSPVQDGLVALEVDNPLNQIVIIRTLSTGTPPTGNIVEILDVYPSDDWGNPKNSFYKGTTAYFNITIKNNDNETRTVRIAINLYDITDTPFGYASFKGSVPADTIASVILGHDIPTTASIGDAYTYANALTEWPRVEGTAYCPEKPAAFQILGTGGGATTNQPIQTSGGSPGGTYEITLRLPFDEKNGSYTTYATSSYEGQKASDNLTFEVKVPDINNDNSVDVFDLVLIAAVYGQTIPPAPPERDLNNDDVIDVFDLVIVSRHYGWTDC